MTTRLLRLLAFAALMVLATGARANYSCTVSSPGFNTAYDVALTSSTIVQTNVTLSCTRGTGDANTMVYTLAANNGLYSNGINNRGRLNASSLVKYDVYQDSLCGTQWKGNRTFTGTLNFGTGTSASVSTTYWGCVQAAQTGLAAGVYSDTVTMTADYGPNPQSTATNTFQVNIAAPWLCSMVNAPGPVAFGNYDAFRATALPASTTFGVNCTAYMPYTIALDTSSGTIAGLAYTLSLSTSSSTGTGALQTHTIDGSMAAGQPGTCSMGTCSGSSPHTLTLTY